MAKRIMDQLIQEGYVRYGFIGIRLEELNTNLAKGLGLDVHRGILVTEVRKGTPAEDAGLQRNDVIVEFDGKSVRDDQRFRLMVGNTPVGSKVPIVVVREGKRKTLEITIGERPDDQIVAAAQPPKESWLGLLVDDINSPIVRERFGRFGSGQEGVVVLRVDEGSPADEAGIRPGDIITEVYSHSVSDLKGYVEIADKLKARRDPIAFLVKRGRSSTYIPVIPEKK
jgi:serine protease Do